MLRTVALALAATVLATPAAHARAGALVDQADPTGDVNVFDGGGTKPTTAQRKTIDLKRFTVTRTGDGVRLTFRIARITAHTDLRPDRLRRSCRRPAATGSPSTCSPTRSTRTAPPTWAARSA